MDLIAVVDFDFGLFDAGLAFARTLILDLVSRKISFGDLRLGLVFPFTCVGCLVGLLF